MAKPNIQEKHNIWEGQNFTTQQQINFFDTQQIHLAKYALGLLIFIR